MNLEFRTMGTSALVTETHDSVAIVGRTAHRKSNKTVGFPPPTSWEGPETTANGQTGQPLGAFNTGAVPTTCFCQGQRIASAEPKPLLWVG